MNPVTRLLNSPYFFWAILALPSIPMIMGVVDGENLKGLLHPSGEFSARFMIITMMISPLMILTRGQGWVRWFMRRRRYLGVAAFGYAALHTVVYLLEHGALQPMLDEALKLGIWTGWVAFVIFVPLAATSNNISVRMMGRSWKRLQQWVYLAAVLTLAHWLFIKYEFVPALVHFVPLAALEGYRLWHTFRPQSRQIAQPG